MNPQLSKAIFGIGIALSVASVASVYVTMLATQNQNLNLQANPTTSQPPATIELQYWALALQRQLQYLMKRSTESLDKILQTREYKNHEQFRSYLDQSRYCPDTATSGQSIDSSDSGQAFDTGTITPGSSGSAVITGLDEISYHCRSHPWMLGILQITPAKRSQRQSQYIEILARNVLFCLSGAKL